MKLEQAANAMRDGDLVLCRGRSVLSWFIRWWTQAPFAHVGVIVWDEHAELGRVPHVIEARLGRLCSIRPLELVIAEDGAVDWYMLLDQIKPPDGGPVLEISRARIAARAREFIGRPYATWLQFLRSYSVGFSRLMDWLRVPDDVDRAGAHCVEVALESVLAGGFQWSGDHDPARMTPGEVSLIGCYWRRGEVTL